jgi:hypothetical protein
VDRPRDHVAVWQHCHFNGKALKRGIGTSANHFDTATGDEYWVSGVKKDGSDRHWAGSGKVAIEASAVREYLQLIGAEELDESRLQVIEDLPETDPARFHALENESLEEKRGRRTNG